MRRSGVNFIAALSLGLIFTMGAGWAADFGFRVDDLAFRFNKAAEKLEVSVRTRYAGCNNVNNMTACNYPVNDRIVVISMGWARKAPTVGIVVDYAPTATLSDEEVASHLWTLETIVFLLSPEVQKQDDFILGLGHSFAKTRAAVQSVGRVEYIMDNEDGIVHLRAYAR